MKPSCPIWQIPICVGLYWLCDHVVTYYTHQYENRTIENKTILNAKLKEQNFTVNVHCHCNDGAQLNQSSGRLCHYQWINDKDCLVKVANLKGQQSFPARPTRCQSLSSFSLESLSNNVGNRIFGYIHPPLSALYTFTLHTSTAAELWLSKDDNCQVLYRICYTNDDPKYRTSQRIYLEKGKKYCTEVIQTTGNAGSFLSVKWKSYDGGVEKNLNVIGKEYISLPGNDKIYVNRNPTSHAIEEWISNFSTIILPNKPTDKHSAKIFYKLQRLSISKMVNLSMPKCFYTIPDYLSKSKLNDAINAKLSIYGESFRTYISPTRGVIGLAEILPGDYANGIIKSILTAMNSTRNAFKLLDIVRVEEKFDKPTGSRYLAEFIVERDKIQYQISEYFFKNVTTQKLCHYVDFQWDQTIFLNIVVFYDKSDQGILRIIKNINKYYTQAHDENFNLMVVSLGNTEVKTIMTALKNTKFKRYQLVKLNATALVHGNVHVMNEAVKHISKKNSKGIVMFFDNTVNFPLNLIEETRKKTIAGLQFYAPKIITLKCGYTIEKPDGYSSYNDFGVLAYYLSDYLHVANHTDSKANAAVLAEKTIANRIDIDRSGHNELFRIYRFKNNL